MHKPNECVSQQTAAGKQGDLLIVVIIAIAVLTHKVRQVRVMLDPPYAQRQDGFHERFCLLG